MDVELQVRNVEFQLPETLPRAWHGAGPAVTLFFNNLSVFFPAGERFFIHAVRAHEPQLTDPRLKADVRLFCGQEGVHGREHIAYNALLARQGYPIADMESRVVGLLERVKRRARLRWQLAATCALEHFTSLLASFVLEDPRVMAGSVPELAALWRWHAAEENEHKAVAFDVYQATGGGWLVRCWVMVLTTLIFWKKVVEQQLRLMRVEGLLFSARAWLSLLAFLFVTPGSMRRLLVPYLRYFSPRFHPWELDNQAVLERWKQEYATSELYGRRAQPQG